MGGKKRGNDSVDVLENQIDAFTDELRSKPAINMKNEENEVAIADGIDAPSSILCSIKPMERRKKRKPLDKERQRIDSDYREVPNAIPRSESLAAHETLAPLPSASSRLPEFHISVFKDLAAADSSIREAAAEALVTELQEVQKAFRKLGTRGTNEGLLSVRS